MKHQIHFFVDFQGQIQLQDFVQVFDNLKAEQVECGDRQGQRVQRWSAFVPFENRSEFVTRAQSCEKVFRVQEAGFAVELQSWI